jgi:hypothetical protein
MSTSFYLSRRALKPAMRLGMPRWQDRLFIALANPRAMHPISFKFQPGEWSNWHASHDLIKSVAALTEARLRSSTRVRQRFADT